MFENSLLAVTFYKLQGNYGGDKYEDWLFDLLSQRLHIRKIEEPRLGGVKTFWSLFKLLKSAYCNRGQIIRPFGLPIYLPGMIVVFHHFDHTDLPWYSRILESIDLFFLKILHSLFKIKILTVSKYWQNWLEEKGMCSEYLVYNVIDTLTFAKCEGDREYLASKYSLNPCLKWIFLGGNQKKKGGDSILDEIILNSNNFLIKEYEFIFSGKETEKDSFKKIIWLEEQDYLIFLRQQQLVIANSQFAEGWCRVVHEALLCGVPVVGSGAGGMAELLNLGGGRIATPNEILSLIISPPEVNLTLISQLPRFIEENNNVQLQKIEQYLVS